MIFLTGPHGAGKTTLSEILSNYNFAYIDLGGILRKKHFIEHPNISFESWRRIGEEKNGTYFTDDIIIEEIKERKKEILSKSDIVQDLVIVGSRSHKGIKYIIDRISRLNDRRNIIIYIDAPIDVLKERCCTRDQRKSTMQEFKELLNKDVRIGIETILPYIDFKISNDGSKEELEEKIKKIVFLDLEYYFPSCSCERS